jgi:hypothetical protein
MAWWQWIVLAAIIGCVIFLIQYRKKLGATGKPPQKGVIR